MTARRLLVILAASGAVCALVLGSSKPSTPRIDAVTLAGEIEHETDHVTATELAEWIRSRKAGLRVIDVRSDSAFQEFHIPSAQHVALSAIPALKPEASETIVLYSDGGAHAAQAWVFLRSAGHQNVYFLRGGLLDWMDEVMNPVLPEHTGNAGADAETEHRGALSRYFGGLPRTGAMPLPDARDAAAAIIRTKRRGC
jgi:rhodanese-related sulfurtransferase